MDQSNRTYDLKKRMANRPYDLKKRKNSLEGNISSTVVGVEDTNKKVRKNDVRQCNSRRSDV